MQSVQHDRDNDWWTFSSRDVDLMREVLVAILKSEIFAPLSDYEKLFGWIEGNQSNLEAAGNTEKGDAKVKK